MPEQRSYRMTLAQNKLAGLGRDYWHQYVRLNGYAFEPNLAGLRVLSRNLDLNIPHLRQCITLYLEN